MAFRPIGGYRPQPSRVPPPVTPDEFNAKWKAAELKERSAAQSHFIDLCRSRRGYRCFLDRAVLRQPRNKTNKLGTGPWR